LELYHLALINHYGSFDHYSELEHQGPSSPMLGIGLSGGQMD